MNELNMLDILLKVSVMGMGWAAVAYLFVSRGNEVSRIRKEYEERIKSMREQLSELKERIKELKEQHREELRKYAKVNKMLLELRNAMDSGAVKLACPKHPDAEVTVLADGTIVCSRGHRVWPPERGKEEVKVEEVEEVEEE
ncbi:MAG: hypothetical protein DRO36_06950 [Candidatus Hecatellales archaeon]|nr:MAG: hypothetical protein DRO36_06950 [Candidatus Hecatellales archaeon]